MYGNTLCIFTVHKKRDRKIIYLGFRILSHILRFTNEPHLIPWAVQSYFFNTFLIGSEYKWSDARGETWMHKNNYSFTDHLTKHCRAARFSFVNVPKRRNSTPNVHKTYQVAKAYTNNCKIYRMAVKYTKIFHSKASQIFKNWDFLVLKYTIWQPREGAR
jgi:hypothetical protein